MSDSYTHLLTHFIFSTKDREPMIADSLRPRLHDYIGGILRAHDCALRSVGGVEDHTHILIRRRPMRAEAEVMRLVKANTSKWIHETISGMGAFAWQRGYAAFSVSLSGADEVCAYIARQREHHARMSFIDELKTFLDRHEIEYKDEFLE